MLGEIYAPAIGSLNYTPNGSFVATYATMATDDLGRLAHAFRGGQADYRPADFLRLARRLCFVRAGRQVEHLLVAQIVDRFQIGEVAQPFHDCRDSA